MCRLRRGAAVLIAVAVGLLSTGCGAGQHRLTLGDVGAGALAGQGGEKLDQRCSTLPVPTGTVNVGCSEGAGAPSATDLHLKSGEYAVVLLCNGAGSVRLAAGHPKDLFPAKVVLCAKGTDVAVERVFALNDATAVTLRTSQTGDGYTAMFLVRVAA